MSVAAFVHVQGRRIEYRRFDPAQAVPGSTTIILLHEGLGSAGMWKDFPQQLAQATGASVVAYSRLGYGQSDPRPETEDPLQMHEQEALLVLPLFLRELEITQPVLFGHSDGASIALVYAGAAALQPAGLVVLAPHVFVEDMCIANIAAAKHTFLTTDMSQRLSRYHSDANNAFWLWNNLWLAPSFKAWNIEHYLPSIRCPVLAIQGYEDEYGTMEQLERLSKGTQQPKLLKLHACGHFPHRDQPRAVLDATKAFIDAL